METSVQLATSIEEVPVSSMLLTRYVGEEVRIGKDIVVRVSYAQRGKVSLIVTAPKGMSVTRRE